MLNRKQKCVVQISLYFNIKNYSLFIVFSSSTVGQHYFYTQTLFLGLAKKQFSNIIQKAHVNWKVLSDLFLLRYFFLNKILWYPMSVYRWTFSPEVMIISFFFSSFFTSVCASCIFFITLFSVFFVFSYVFCFCRINSLYCIKKYAIRLIQNVSCENNFN